MSQVNPAIPVGPDHPDLPVKPPLVWLLALVLGWWLHRFMPLPSRGSAFGWVGLVVLAAGVLLALWSLLSLRAAQTPVEPWKATRSIVDRGPYAFTRNPIYLAFAIVVLGAGLWIDRFAVVVMVVPALLVTDRVIVRREERYLTRKFGEAYLSYRQRVRRWI
ncbi:MAG: methyltransferase family protein [Gemmatimonadaceae bacterium]